jgi:hypothetical protein
VPLQRAGLISTSKKLKPITDPTEFIVRITSLSNPLIDGLEPSEPLSIKSV